MRKNGVFQPLKYYKSTAEALCFTVLLPFFRLRLNDTAPCFLLHFLYLRLAFTQFLMNRYLALGCKSESGESENDEKNIYFTECCIKFKNTIAFMLRMS